MEGLWEYSPAGMGTGAQELRDPLKAHWGKDAPSLHFLQGGAATTAVTQLAELHHLLLPDDSNSSESATPHHHFP